MRFMKKEAAKIPIMYLGLVVLCVILDRVSKAWALKLIGGYKPFPGLLEFWVYRNHGGAFGLAGPQARTPLIAAMSVMIALLFTWAWFTDLTKTMRHFGFACMIGGAAGNLSDRVTHGFVVDFIQIGGFPVFNIADMAVVLGMTLVAWDVIRDGKLSQS